MMLMQRDSVVLGLVVLISVSASFPHGSGHQNTGHAHYEDMFKRPGANSDVLCNKLRRYIDIMLRSALPNCEGFVPQVADKDGESCSSSPSSISIIKECAEEHEETPEAAECVTNVLKSSSTSPTPINPSCFCQSMSDSFMSIYSTSKMFCGKNSCDGLFLDILGLEDRKPKAIFASLVAFAATKAGAVLIPAAATVIGSVIAGGAAIGAAAIATGGEERDGNSLTHPKCSDFLHGMGGIIDIPETDSTFYTDKLFSIIHSFNEPLVGELYYQLSLPFKLSGDQHILPKKVDGQGAKWKTDEVIFEEVPPQAQVAWSVQTKVKTLKTTRIEVNGNVLCEEV